MKTGARFLTLLLAVLMIAGAAFTVSASDFRDVPDNYTYRDAIDVLARLGVIGGYEDGTYRPDNNVERDEMTKLVFVLKTTFAEAGEGRSEFTDTEGNWANGFISYCVSEGIIGGHGDGTFKPDDDVTYDQALKMVCAALGYKDFDSNKWPTDVRLVGIKTLGLNKGLPDSLNGSDYLTRGQVAQIFYNALFVPMNETKTVEGSVITSGGITNTVEVTMQLARDVWNFKSYTGTVLAAENFCLAGSAATGNEEQIVVGNFVDDETNEAAADLDRAYYLEALGLDAYIGEADAFVGRNIKIFEFDGELIESSALVAGSVEYNVELALVKSGTKDDLTKISIAGEKYDLADVMAYVDGSAYTKGYTSGKIAKTDAAYGKFPVDANGDFIADADVPDVLKNLFNDSNANAKAVANVAIDSDGDGVYDYLFITGMAPYTLDSIKSVKVDGEKTEKYTFASVLTIGGSADDIDVYSEDLVTDIVLEEDDVVILYSFGGKTYVEQVVDPVSTYITKNTKGTIKLYGQEEDFWVNADATSAFVGFDNTSSITGVGEDATEGQYYIYNNRIFMVADMSANSSELTNTAILRGTEGVTDWELDPEENKYYQFYPAILFENGMEKKVNVNALNGYTVDDEEFLEQYEQFIIARRNDGTMKYFDELVAYTVDEDGYYGIYTYDYYSELVYDGDAELFLSAFDGEYEVQYLESSGLYRVYNINDESEYYLFDIDNSTVMYYYNKDGELDFNVGTENAFTNDVDGSALPYGMQLKVGDDGVYVLSSVMFTELSSAVESRADKFDEHLLFYGEDAALRLNDDTTTPHYSYIYFDIMKASSMIAEPSRLSVDEGAVPMKTGYIAVYREDNSLERIKPSDNFENPNRSEYLFYAKVENIDIKNNIIVTNINPEGISLDGALIRALSLNKESAQLVGIDGKVDMNTMYSAYEASQDEEVPFYIIYAYDPEAEQVVYVLYGREEESDYNSMDNVYEASIK